jgi:hypothetical protein
MPSVGRHRLSGQSAPAESCIGNRLYKAVRPTLPTPITGAARHRPTDRPTDDKLPTPLPAVGDEPKCEQFGAPPPPPLRLVGFSAGEWRRDSFKLT